MPRDLILHRLNLYVQETIDFLLANLTRNQSVSPPTAGWHNFFRPGRIGTTGTAVPLLFLVRVGADFPYKEEMVNRLVTSQLPNGAWTILSLANVPTIEGTAWPMRALAFAGDAGARTAVHKAEEWVLTQQNGQGAWGSDRNGSPRMLLTAISMESLAALSAPSREAISKAVKWFSQNQRTDGSWGAEPGQDGTVFHTARVTKALIDVALLPSDPRIAAAIHFLKNNWIPDGKNFLQEIYDVHFAETYSRIIIEHDVDSAVAQALLAVRPVWATELILRAVGEMVELHSQAGKLSPPNMQPSIWNIIPRATVFFELLQHFPVCEGGRVMNLKEAIVYSPSQESLNRRRMAGILLRGILIPRFPWTSLFLLFFIAITAIAVSLYYMGSIQFKELALSLFGNLAVLSLSLYIDSKRWGKNG